MPMPDALPAGLTEGQQTAVELRRLLRDLGCPEDRVLCVSVQSDDTGQAYVYVPPLPVELVQHIVNLLPAPPDGKRHP